MRKVCLLFAIGIFVAGIAASASAAGKIEVPKYKRWVLKNGLTLLVAENHEVPLFSMRLMIRSGSKDDPVGKEGLADVTATLLRRGAGNRNAKEFAEAVDVVGGSLRTGAGIQTSYASAEFMAKDVDLGVSLLADLLIRPTFDPDEVERELRQAVAARKQALDNPRTLAEDQTYIQLFGGHPYGHPSEGLASSLESVTRQDITQFYTRNWNAANATLAVVGDVNTDRVKKLVEQQLGEWNRGKRNGSTVPEPTPVSERRVVLVSKPDATQSQIRICQVGIQRDDPDFFPVTVANTILGGGFTSWLVDEIRVNRGLSYGARSSVSPYAVGGLYQVSTFTKNATTGETIEVALEQLERLRRGDVDEATLQKAQNYINGLYPLRLETSDAIAAALLDLEYYGQSREWLENYAKSIEKVTLDDVKRVATEDFPYDNLLLLVVGDTAAIHDQLTPFGPVEIVEPD